MPAPEHWTPLPRAIASPAVDFLDVLRGRRSAVGGDVALEDLSSLLWHSTLLRSRHPRGRFGIPWESRPAPSGGGLHATRLIVLPLGDRSGAGEYVPDHHGLAAIHHDGLAANRSSVLDILGARTGATIQFAFDAELLGACYEHSETLMWRDSGALAATICLVATALGLTSVTLGRTGETVLRATGVDPRLVAAGAVHIGTPHAHGRLVR